MVYKVPCKDCHHTYIGETNCKKTLKVRLGEDKQVVKRADQRRSRPRLDSNPRHWQSKNGSH